MPTRRKFINKKNSITFQLVHRSQHDPLIADDTAGERVLVPLEVRCPILPERFVTDWFHSLQTEQRKTEQKKFGIDYDDDYDYMQHLRDPCAPPERYAVHVDQIEEDDEDEEDEDEEEEEVNWRWSFFGERDFCV